MEASEDLSSFAVLGVGAVGGLIGATLHRAGVEVDLVCSPRTKSAIDRRGLTVRSQLVGDFTVRPRTVETLDRKVDVVVVATKAHSLRPALDRIHRRPSFVLPLLNGIDHIGALRAAGYSTICATIRIQSDRPELGLVVQEIPFGEIEIADGPDRSLLDRLGARLTDLGIPTRIGENEAGILWRKLVRLNALACTTAAADRSIGWIRDSPLWRELLIGCVEEGCAVAKAEGVECFAEALTADLMTAAPGLGSSMQRDLQRGLAPELDAIPGAVLRAGRRHRIACPATQELVIRIQERLSDQRIYGNLPNQSDDGPQ